jgi:hypothetical protein
MVEEILWALGDDITVPLKKRLPLIAWTLVKRAPLLLKKVEPPLPGIRP